MSNLATFISVAVGVGVFTTIVLWRWWRQRRLMRNWKPELDRLFGEGQYTVRMFIGKYPVVTVDGVHLICREPSA